MTSCAPSSGEGRAFANLALAGRMHDLTPDGAPRLPEWVLSEITGWAQDAWGVKHARLLLRDGRVLAPVAILPSGDLAGWAEAGEVQFSPDDIVAIEPAEQ
jgi:hypothetical protein